MRRILFVALIVGILSSCSSAQFATSDNASGKDGTGEETASLRKGLAGEGTAEPATSTVVAGSDPKPGARSESSAIGTSAMVSFANPLATQAGLDILTEGENAFDAAVAVGSALNVVEPMVSGASGYGAIVIYDAKEGKTRFLDTGGGRLRRSRQNGSCWTSGTIPQTGMTCRGGSRTVPPG